MLQTIHIQNLALIRELDADFTRGFNVLTGETGAGKSIIIDAIGLGLGDRLSRSLLREGETGLVELVFSVDDENTRQALLSWGIEAEDGTVIISRKFTDGKGSIRINGETRTMQELRKVAEILIDIHGQSEHQKLLREEQQLALLDRFGGEKIEAQKEIVAQACRKWSLLKSELSAAPMKEEERLRQLSFLEYECSEIRAANLQAGEDALLEGREKLLANAEKISQTLSEIHAKSGEEGAQGCVGKALQRINALCEYDEKLAILSETLTQAEDLLNEFNRGLSDYGDTLETDPASLAEIGERLDLINRLKMKYGQSIEAILAAASAREEEIRELEEYEARRKEKQAQLLAAEELLKRASFDLRELRKEAAGRFAAGVAEQLSELNFPRSDFSVRFEERPYSENGADQISFFIATNPGEAEQPLNKVASGGELSRVMLGIKTLFAKRNTAETLIFDEVDAGISGRTAQKVAERMRELAKAEQLICITHLPQIAAMADSHFAIVKDVTDRSALTRIEALTEEASVRELARLLGGAEITANTLQSAREMRAQARGKRRE